MSSKNSVNNRIPRQSKNQEPKMRALLSVILYLTMAVCIMANFERGERQEGDYVITSRTIFKPMIPWKVMKAVIHVTAPSINQIITYFKVSNMGASEASFILLSGSIGTRTMTVIAIGKRGQGMLVRVEAAAIDLSAITTPVPTTPAKVDTTTMNTIMNTTLIPSEE